MLCVCVCVCVCVWGGGGGVNAMHATWCDGVACSNATTDQLGVIARMTSEIQGLKVRHESFQEEYTSCTY